MKGNKTLGIILIIAVVATALFALAINFKAGEVKYTEDMELKKVIENPVSDDSMMEDESMSEGDLEPMLTDDQEAIDSELQAIDSELDTLMDESLDDLSDIENNL